MVMLWMASRRSGTTSCLSCCPASSLCEGNEEYTPCQTSSVVMSLTNAATVRVSVSIPSCFACGGVVGPVPLVLITSNQHAPGGGPLRMTSATTKPASTAASGSAVSTTPTRFRRRGSG
ncbi:hypothetical protein TraAM80_02967 [Trypanosoma rangeli]|uniref:Uncharacterized protein n=1 Tax=Trypanosoma rangeli TaxID=5698 RepID=A0A422NRD3_TRYRA|nr:uncharacterized protein TraAM80_02967 [Trypanosoma rangeli]RNF08033.1 hypothetical protein TraAM80_02967 [Trypanosoma rangeli]|eukprot:RNF08033.1 hypothetical protein TraAM80_02967 [Trypanosoma rangeli]